MSGGPIDLDVGALLWVGFHGTSAPDELLARIAAGHVGAAILFARNLVQANGETDIDALVALTSSLHAAGDGRRLLVAIDQEGGRVQRVRAPGTVWPPMLAFDAVDDARAEPLAEAVGQAVGAELAAVGVDVDFAPVLDVHTNAANPVIGDRAFATRPDRAAARALAFARGLERAGVIGCGKHFPGHGDTSTDSHLELPRVDHDLARLRSVELAPFSRAAQEGIPMIMTAHVVFAAVDATRPATLSRAVIDGVLRRELGYAGVIVSDDLDMQAIRSHYGAGDAALAAVEAGCDVLLLCADRDAQDEVFEALVRRASSDAAFGDRVRESAARVRALSRGRPAARPADPGAVLGCAAHRALARELAEAGGD